MDKSMILCPKVERSFEIISKKWAALIIHVLMDGPKRFSEIDNIIPDLSKRMLTERIKELEELGIVVRHVIPERPVRTEYLLTKKGTELGKSLAAISSWADKWL